MTVHIKPLDIKLSVLEQMELSKFMKYPDALLPCPDDSPRIELLKSLVKKGYITLEIEKKGYNFYKLKEA